jgi:hypothetical protein
MLYNNCDQVNVEIKTDICVIGSGIGGGSIIAELAKTDADFVLIEAGGIDKHVDSVKMDNIGREFKMPTTRSIELGGTSTIWGGGLTCLEEIDFIKKKYLPHSGWPIKLDELLPYYKRACDIYGVDYFDHFDENLLPDNFKKEIKDIHADRDVFYNKIFQIPQPIYNFKKLLIDFFQDNTSRHCYCNTAALEFIHENGEMKGLIVGSTKGTYKVVANKYIVCAGALETPRLLLNSKLDNINIGKYLMDHPKGYLCQLNMKDSGIPKKHIYAFMKYNNDKIQIKTGLLLKDNIQKAKLLLNHHSYIKPIIGNLYSMRKIEILGVLIHTFRNSRNILRDLFFILMHFPSLLKGIAYKFDFSAIYKKAGIFVISEQIPSSKSFVALSSKKDKWGYPIAQVNWQLDDKDIENIKEYYQTIKPHLNYDDSAFMYGMADDLNDWSRVCNSAAHHCGTARMSDSQADGVVDKNLKVFNTNNLFVCDTSVFTTSGNANPSFTVSALAVRLVEYLTGNNK